MADSLENTASFHHLYVLERLVGKKPDAIFRHPEIEIENNPAS